MPSLKNTFPIGKLVFQPPSSAFRARASAKKLFSRETRTFSHGCIRLGDPFGFAHALLAVQVSDPEQFFQSKLKTGKETKVELDRHVPVHLMYRTAFSDDKGRIHYRRDVYGRDARIWSALVEAGVVLEGVQG